MGYFSNGIEGELYYEKYCANCCNSVPEGTCPVWMLHLDYNYQRNEREDIKNILDSFIPREEPGFNGNGQCLMFLKKEDCISLEAVDV